MTLDNTQFSRQNLVSSLSRSETHMDLELAAHVELVPSANWLQDDLNYLVVNVSDQKSENFKLVYQLKAGSNLDKLQDGLREDLNLKVKGLIFGNKEVMEKVGAFGR